MVSLRDLAEKFDITLSNHLQSLIFYLPLEHMKVSHTLFFPFQHNPKNLDHSYRTDLDFGNFILEEKSISQLNFI